MKKVLAMVLVFVMLPVWAMACEMVPEESAGMYTGCAGWAVVGWCNEVAGIKAPSEMVDVLPVQRVSGDYIRGFAKGGLIRVKAAVTLFRGPDGWIGLHKVQTAIRIAPDMLGLVSEIVERRVGTEPTVASIIAATMWRAGDTVSHMFFCEGSGIIQVGTVTVHGESTLLWAGDFDGDGTLELGFTFGVLEQAKKPEPEKEPEKKPAPVKTCQQKKTCFEVRVDLSVVFKGCVTLVKRCFEGVCRGK